MRSVQLVRAVSCRSSARCAVSALIAAPAFAHEERDRQRLSNGGRPHRRTRLHRPARAVSNSSCTRTSSRSTGLEKTLQAEVIYGTAKRPLPLTAHTMTRTGAYESVVHPDRRRQVHVPHHGHAAGRLHDGRDASPRARRASTRSRSRRRASSRCRSASPAELAASAEGGRRRGPGHARPRVSAASACSSVSPRSASRSPVGPGRADMRRHRSAAAFVPCGVALTPVVPVARRPDPAVPRRPRFRARPTREQQPGCGRRGRRRRRPRSASSSASRSSRDTRRSTCSTRRRRTILLGAGDRRPGRRPRARGADRPRFRTARTR